MNIDKRKDEEMFKKKNKLQRRQEDTYLSMDNGEVVDDLERKKITKEEKKTKPVMSRSRNCDDISDEDLKIITEELDVLDNTPFKSFPDEQSNEEDNTVSDMKATIFNIFKFMFIFCLVAIIGYLLYKTGPSIVNTAKDKINFSFFSNSSNDDKNNSSNIENDSDSKSSLGLMEQHKQNQEAKKLKVTMNNMNTMNDKFKQNWALLKSYCEGFSNNQFTIYMHDKNMEAQNTAFSNTYLEFLNTEEEYTTDCDKALFELYRQRYDNLMNCMTELKDSSSYNRSTVIDVVNKYVESDNSLNNQEFDLLIENFNMYGISYEITEDKIIMVD